jgi:peptide deformylase
VIRPVLTYPHPILKRVCEPVEPGLGMRLAEDLVDTMRAHPRCAGLAAPQIGEAARVAVVDAGWHPLATSSSGLVVLLNPVITEQAGRHLAREGCLSLPQITADVRRASRITVLTGDQVLLWSQGFEARAIQHELDHLDGILILDRVESVHALHQREPWVARPSSDSAPP